MVTGPVLRCDGLVKSFGDRVAVDGISFHIDPGETYGLLGPNGAGKTTTISIVAGVLAADAGSVTLSGTRMDPNAVAAKAKLGFVPQDVALYPDLTGRENLRFFGRLAGLRDGVLDRRVAEVLEIVGLSDRAGERVDRYSGGMKRRANIAAGLLHRPELLILDEPTVGVDPQSRNAILEAVDALGGEGLAVLYTTHYMEEAERLCDRIGIIDLGRLVAEGTHRELVAGLGERDRLRVVTTGAADVPAFAARLGDLSGVEAVSVAGRMVELQVADAAALVPPVLAEAASAGVGVAGVEMVEPDLETVFLHLTGRALRD